MSALSALLRREFSLAFGRGGGPLLALAFYACVTSLAPLAAGRSPATLGAVAPGLAWLALSLASLLSLERLFERDYEDGALDVLALGPIPLELTCAVKCLAQWLAAGAPLALGGRRGGLLVAVIVLPLFAPPVIFGAGALWAFAEGLPWQSGLLLLGGYTAAAVGLAPFGMAAACRNALS